MLPTTTRQIKSKKIGVNFRKIRKTIIHWHPSPDIRWRETLNQSISSLSYQLCLRGQSVYCIASVFSLTARRVPPTLSLSVATRTFRARVSNVTKMTMFEWSPNILRMQRPWLSRISRLIFLLQCAHGLWLIAAKHNNLGDALNWESSRN